MDLAVALGIALLLGIAIGAIGVHYIHHVASTVSKTTTPTASVASSVQTPVAAAISDLQSRVTAAETALSTVAAKITS